MKNKLGDEQRLRHILSAISEIESYTVGVQKNEFLKNSMMRFASIKRLEIIGEACNHLSKELKQQAPDVQWNEIIGMRHVFVHEYFGIDNILLWRSSPKIYRISKTHLFNYSETSSSCYAVPNLRQPLF